MRNFDEDASQSARGSEECRSSAINVVRDSLTAQCAPTRSGSAPFPSRARRSAGRRRIGERPRCAAPADRADRRRGPRPADVERQMRPRPAIPRRPRRSARRVSRKSPALGGEIDQPVQFGGHAAARHHAPLDPSAAVGERQRNLELVERRSAEAHVSPDVDRPAPAAAQRLLQVDAEDGAVRRLERGRSGRGSRSRRRAKRRTASTANCAPPLPVIERAGRNWRSRRRGPRRRVRRVRSS